MTRTSCFSPSLSVSLSSSVARSWLNVSSSRPKHSFQLPLLSSASVSGQTSPPPQAKWQLSHSGSKSPAVPIRQFIALSAAAALAFYFRLLSPLLRTTLLPRNSLLIYERGHLALAFVIISVANSTFMSTLIAENFF